MNLLSKFDRSSKVLMMISVLGIASSLTGLYFTYTTEEVQNTSEDAIAQLSFSKADTRIKRAGNLHWFSVDQPIFCYKNDIVFTGENSTATIEFPQGDKVHLLPNSLVSITNKMLTLESGSIEVDLKGQETGQEQIGIETFGKVIKLEQKTKFRVINNKEEKKVISITGRIPKKAVPENIVISNEPVPKDILAKVEPPKIIEFNALAPRPGMVIPRFDHYPVTLDWHYSGPKQNFKVTIAGRNYNANESELTLTARDLPAGPVSWKVTNAEGKSIESSFEMTDDFRFKILHPENRSVHTVTGTDQLPVDFSWTSPVEFAERIQIASDRIFQNIVVNSDVKNSAFQQLLSAGDYFWRIGYMEGGKLLHWSDIRTFTVKSVPLVIPKIILKQVPESLDFTLTPVQTMQIMINLPMKNLIFKVTGAGFRRTGKVLNKRFNLPQLKDGTYTLIINGETADGVPVESQPYELKVKNAKQLEAPKIQGKKVKIFVKVFNFISDLIFPSAFARDPVVVPLEWEARDAEAFEIEITGADKTKVIEKKEVKSNSYDFTIPGPGVYYWRVRERSGKRWGPYSEFTEILAQDKVSLLNKPLMKKATTKGNTFYFEWNEPYPDLKYTLNIYRGRSKEPEKTLKVSGGKATVRLKKDEEKIYWRMSAVSAHGNEIKDRKKFLVPNSQAAPTPPKTYPFILKAGYLQANHAYEQTAEDSSLSSSNQSLSLTGAAYFLRGEYWGEKYGYTLGTRSQSLSEDETKYTDSEYTFEMAMPWKKDEVSTQNIAIGFLFGMTKLTFTDTDGEYTRAFVTLRHQYERLLTPNWKFELNTTLLQPAQIKIIPPSFRLAPSLNWNFIGRWWASAIVGYEMNRSNLAYSEDGNTGQLDVSSNIMTYGLGLTWRGF